MRFRHGRARRADVPEAAAGQEGLSTALYYPSIFYVRRQKGVFLQRKTPYRRPTAVPLELAQNDVPFRGTAYEIARGVAFLMVTIQGLVARTARESTTERARSARNGAWAWRTR